MTFIDGNGITPGTERCNCTDECEFPCWQRVGMAPACQSCGCPPFPDLRPRRHTRQMSRNKPLRARPKSKGNRAEREVIDLLHAYGWTEARRNFQSGGQGGGDIIGGPADTHIEVKHRERCAIWEWIEQATSEARPTDVPLVAFRRNRSGWMACVPLDEYLALLRLRETS